MEEVTKYILPDELYHHGVKGMKWGVRRYQDKNGNLTSLGKRRLKKQEFKSDARGLKMKNDYDTKVKNYNRKHPFGLTSNQKELNNISWAKRDYDDYKLYKTKIEGFNKSKHTLRLEQRYKSKGMNDQEAAIAAYKRAKTEKIIAAAGSVTLASAMAIAAYKHYDNTVDKIIKPGTKIQNITNIKDRNLDNPFYMSYKKSDKTKYKGLYGNQIKKQMSLFGVKSAPVYSNTGVTKDSIKVASNKSATKVLKDLMANDPDFRKDLIKSLQDSTVFSPNDSIGGAKRKLADNAIKDLQRNKITDRVYKAMNVNLVDHSKHNQEKVTNKFYNALKKNGYDALTDINDKKYSGYGAKAPTIIINGKKIGKRIVNELSDTEINSAHAKAQNAIISKAVGKILLTYGSIGLAEYGGLRYASNKQESKFVETYRKKHPNTELSYNEILKLRS